MKGKIVKAVALAMAGFVLASHLHIPTQTIGLESNAIVALAANRKEQAAFIDKVGPLAVQDMKETGILASVTIAQAILESGWGLSKLATDSKNYFGIKASAGWNGGVTNMATEEYEAGRGYYTIVDGFRKYKEVEDSIKDHSKFLLENSRYKGVQYVTDPKSAITLIWNAGYATSPNYVSSIMSLIKSHDLTRFDKQALAELEAEKQALEAKRLEEEAAAKVAAEKAATAEAEARAAAEEASLAAYEEAKVAAEEVAVLEKKVQDFADATLRSADVELVKEPEEDKEIVSAQDEQIIPVEEIKEDKPVVDSETGESVTKDDIKEANAQEVKVSEIIENKKQEESSQEPVAAQSPSEEVPEVYEEGSRDLYKDGGGSLFHDVPEVSGMAIAYMEPTFSESPGMNIGDLDLVEDFSEPDEAKEEGSSFFRSAQDPREDVPSPSKAQDPQPVNEISGVQEGSQPAPEVSQPQEEQPNVGEENAPIEKNLNAESVLPKVEDTASEVKEASDEKGNRIIAETQSNEDKKAEQTEQTKKIDANKVTNTKTNKVKAPRTGDFANYILYIVIALLCLVGLGYVIFSGKHKSNKKK